MSLDEAAHLAQELEEYNRTHFLEFYEPYEFQRKFHHAKGGGKFVPVPSDLKKEGLATRKGLMAANQVGKTFCGGAETAIHATGIYPDWWEGHRFTKPVEIIVSSTTNETTRDRCQKELLGEPSDDDMKGTGTIPIDRIGKTTRKAGVPNALESVLVKHSSGGWSKINFKCYEQGPKKFMGYRIHVAWADEEPPSEIWSQLLRGLLATNGIAYITFTPEEGVTDVVYELMEGDKPGYGLVRASWDDAPHMSPEMREQKLQDYPVHEREMRSKGEPMVGTGLIFPVPDEDIVCDPFEIPVHYPRIIGFDIGDDHPAALVWMAEDRDTQTTYIYRTWRASRQLIPMIADVMKKGDGEWIPIAWPHDGMKRDTQSGKVIADIYREEYGLNMHPERFSNPPGAGQKEGQGGQGVEAGIHSMLTAMMEGRFKVFSNCSEFFEEKRMYHRKDGQIVKMKDDVMSAARYAYMMRRHAITKPMPNMNQNIQRTGLRNW